jgi:hypothetical protein
MNPDNAGPEGARLSLPYQLHDAREPPIWRHSSPAHVCLYRSRAFITGTLSPWLFLR